MGAADGDRHPEAERQHERDHQEHGLPLPDRLVTMLRSTKARQARERLALGSDSGRSSTSSRTKPGSRTTLQVLSRYWAEAVEAAGVRHIKLHAARHNCGL